MWYCISANDFSSHIPAGGGVYRVHCFADDRQKSVMPVQRVLGVDAEGVLYIGKGEAFINRVVHLKKSILPNYRGSGHICGRRYKNALYESFTKHFPPKLLCVSFQPAELPLQAEEAALVAYVGKFGELPPLNRQG